MGVPTEGTSGRDCRDSVFLVRITLQDVPLMEFLYFVVVEVVFYVHRNRRFIRDGSPGRPPRLSHSSWALKYLVFTRRQTRVTAGDSGLCCCVCVTSFACDLTPLIVCLFCTGLVLFQIATEWSTLVPKPLSGGFCNCNKETALHSSYWVLSILLPKKERKKKRKKEKRKKAMKKKGYEEEEKFDLLCLCRVVV